MEDYQNRTYRTKQGADRVSFVVKYKTTDLWIAVDRASYSSEMRAATEKLVVDLRSEMEYYLALDPDYATALTPCAAKSFAPPIMERMSCVSFITGIGPMGGVAGACAEYVANELRQKFDIREIVIENGGDIYASFLSPFDVQLFAGQSPLSNKVGIRLSADLSPVGICTSSGTVGPSLSFGKADAVMIVCHDVVLADSYATAIANMVQTVDDVERVADYAASRHEIVAAMVVKDDRLGCVGEQEMIYF